MSRSVKVAILSAVILAVLPRTLARGAGVERKAPSAGQPFYGQDAAVNVVDLVDLARSL